MHLNKNKNEKKDINHEYTDRTFWVLRRASLSSKHWDWDKEIFMDFDRSSSAVWVSLLIVHLFLRLIQSGSSVPVLKRAQTVPIAEVGVCGKSLYTSAPGERDQG